MEKQLEQALAENERLRKQLEEALRANKRSVAPFSKGKPKPKPDPKPPGRKPGAAYGQRLRDRFPATWMSKFLFPFPHAVATAGVR